jgi:hypothetical protein
MEFCSSCADRVCAPCVIAHISCRLSSVSPQIYSVDKQERVPAQRRPHPCLHAKPPASTQCAHSRKKSTNKTTPRHIEPPATATALCRTTVPALRPHTACARPHLVPDCRHLHGAARTHDADSSVELGGGGGGVPIAMLKESLQLYERANASIPAESTVHVDATASVVACVCVGVRVCVVWVFASDNTHTRRTRLTHQQCALARHCSTDTPTPA